MKKYRLVVMTASAMFAISAFGSTTVANLTSSSVGTKLIADNQPNDQASGNQTNGNGQSATDQNNNTQSDDQDSSSNGTTNTDQSDDQDNTDTD